MRATVRAWPQPRSNTRPALQSAGERRPAGAGWIARSLTLTLLTALIALVFAKINLTVVARALSNVNTGWLALACVLMAGSFLARAVSWFAVIRAALPSDRIGRSPVTRGRLIEMAGSSVPPGTPGEARPRVHHRQLATIAGASSRSTAAADVNCLRRTPPARNSS
jgi:uncharacterized membrane protein YbhN (UPF0104 family)